MPPSLPTLLRWPLWAVQLGTGAKSFIDNPILGSRRLNAMGLHRLRVRAAHGMARWRRWWLRGGVSAEDRRAFQETGYVEWRDVLPSAAFERMRGLILDRAWPARDFVQGHTVTRRIDVDAAMLEAVPDLKALLDLPRWRGLMHYVAASRARPFYFIQTILTHRGPPEQGEDPQTNIHADAFHPSMKAWLFLTDVTLEEGPFRYVPGSHRPSAARLDWEEHQAQVARGLDQMSARGSLRIEAEELAGLGLPQPVPFAVPANTLVVADTFGFHARGLAQSPSIRVELWAYSRRNPFLPWTGLHLDSLPWVARRRAAFLWRVREWMARSSSFPIPDAVPRRPMDL